KAKMRDGAVHVNALNRGVWGVVLRYSSPESFLMAGYGTYMKEIPGHRPYAVFVTERTSDHWSTTQVSTKDVGGSLSERIHLEVRIKGPEVELTVSDGNREDTVRHLIKERRLNEAGTVGLIQLTGAGQAFTNFRLFDLVGKVVLEETFQGQNGTLPAGWNYIFGP